MANSSLKTNKPPLSYAEAGVDIDAGNALVQAIKPLIASTMRPGADGNIGGFGGVFDIAAAGYRDPLLIAANDGVGTKLKLAIETADHSRVGVDLVAMCVNDLIVQGAEPLFFLDYFATGVLEPGVAETVISGIAEGCRQAGCALIGGETAEMPGMYVPGDYDLAGFSVGAVERDDLLPRETDTGGVLLGLASSGVHSNGFSLVRRIVERAELGWDSKPEFCADTTLGNVLLEPTRIYVKPLLATLRETQAIHAIAHITGGGLTENIPRVLPDGVEAHIDLTAWELPAVFHWLQREGNVEEAEMLRTFNCGIGIVLVVDEAQVEAVTSCLRDQGETVYRIGYLTEGTGGVAYLGQLTGGTR